MILRVFPLFSDANQTRGKESILRHYDKVSEKTAQSLVTKTDQMIVHESKRIKASKAAQRKALLSNNPQVLPELYFNWFFGPITVIVIRIWGFVLCHQLFSSPIKDQGRLPFTPSIRVEILGVNIQCCRFSKRKMGRSENVLASIGKFKRKRKNALIKSIAYNF